MSLCQRVDASLPLEFQPEWLTRIQSMEGAEGAQLRKRLKCQMVRVDDQISGN